MIVFIGIVLIALIISLAFNGLQYVRRNRQRPVPGMPRRDRDDIQTLCEHFVELRDGDYPLALESQRPVQTDEGVEIPFQTVEQEALFTYLPADSRYTVSSAQAIDGETMRRFDQSGTLSELTVPNLMATIETELEHIAIDVEATKRHSAAEAARRAKLGMSADEHPEDEPEGSLLFEQINPDDDTFKMPAALKGSTASAMR